MLHIVLVLRLRSPGCEPCLRTSGLFCAFPRFANQALFSLPEGRERSRRSSLNGRGLRFVVIGHFSHFGARFPVFGAVRPCASVRDRLTTSVCPSFWHTPCFLSLEGHCGPGDHLRGRTPPPVLNSLFSGPRAARFGPRTFVLHRFGFIFGRNFIFIVRKVVEGWEASNCSEDQLYSFIALYRPFSSLES